MRTQIDTPIPLFSGTNSRQSLSSIDSDVFKPLIIPNPIDALPMELIYAIDRYVTPPASPTQPNNEPLQRSEGNSERPFESTSSRKLEENTMVPSMTTITESGELVASQCLVAGHLLILLVQMSNQR